MDWQNTRNLKFQVFFHTEQLTNPSAFYADSHCSRLLHGKIGEAKWSEESIGQGGAADYETIAAYAVAITLGPSTMGKEDDI